MKDNPKNRHLLGIGNVVYEFQILEFRLQILIAELIGNSSSVAQLVTCEMSFSALVHAFSSIVQLRVTESESLNRSIALCSLLDLSAEKRNVIVHSFYIDDEDEQLVRLRAKAKRKGYRLNVSNNTKLAAELSEALETLNECRKELEDVTITLKVNGYI